MLQKCPVCGTMVPSGKFCPNCGMQMKAPQTPVPDPAPNPAPAPAPVTQPDPWADRTPRTIEELQQWYTDHNLPPQETTRFFIGIDYKEPRAFGIYREPDGNVTVYKNKDTGVRAVRYSGPDEAYGVNELYLRLKQEIANQKALNRPKTPAELERERQEKKKAKIILTVFAVFIVLCFIGVIIYFINMPDNGYYHYNGDDYYYLSGDWYYYDYDDDCWSYSYYTPDELEDDYSDYYEGDYYGTDYGYSDFEDTQYYEDYQESLESDSDSSWDSSDSWDSGGTDFSSDW